ncbi:hypothetical protein P175DRAFT_0475009 [Aspergillus ochraceoroseus IBT 24754]|uniref:Aromatic prenyltransferase (DMATS family) n=1 Tax=Aspergillus ochraceoroseus IBT 24754 TaxID=1392256 RepID=A0A2T5M3L2_9EURO|nr:uncharacterized protein P175DRAFT_0475009 [Aspergillus ochraceoroseus IBT 24754]PTU23109.1 hypothetical protein P175DRAFT_0475009 [Aspergillus ochraceoroseus IBT 24754]
MNLESPQTSQQAWKVLDRTLHFPNSDHKLWWDRLAPVLGPSLHLAGYDIEAQYRSLLAIYSAIIPSLGPFPNSNRTNVTWTHALCNKAGPLEASINYQQGAKCAFRLGVEPVGPYAGTDADPINEVAGKQLLQRLSHVQPGGVVDLSLFDYFASALGVDAHAARTHWDSLAGFPCKSHTVVGVDFHHHHHHGAPPFTVKSYFGTFVKSVVAETDVLRLTFDSFRRLLCCPSSTRPAAAAADDDDLHFDFSQVEEYVSANRDRFMLEKSYVAFDCKAPAQSRVKVYVMASVASLREVYDFWTLGGRLRGADLEAGFGIVKRVWNAIYPQQLPSGGHREAMQIQVNWEMSLKNASVVPKIYLLVADDYDEHVSNAVVDLFEDLGWTEHIQTHRLLEKEAYSIHGDCGFQGRTDCYLWLAFAYSGRSGPYITVYTNPVVSTAVPKCIT